jgi:hypothetical protein
MRELSPQRNPKVLNNPSDLEKLLKNYTEISKTAYEVGLEKKPFRQDWFIDRETLKLVQNPIPSMRLKDMYPEYYGKERNELRQEKKKTRTKRIPTGLPMDLYLQLIEGQ